jgi:peptide/nickel transport system substrate-binding protein
MQRTRWKRSVLALVAVVVSGLAMTTGAPAGPSAAAPQKGGELVVAIARDLLSADPQRGGNTDAVIYNYQVAEVLVLFGQRGLDPWLLESWSADPDGTFTWKVRKNVKFTDGTPLNAEAVKFSIERLLDTRNEMPYRSYFLNRTERIDVVDDYTLKVKNKAFDVEFMDRMTLVGVVSPTAVRRGVDFRRQPVGSGAFKLASYTPGERIVLERNSDYWRPGEPYLDRVVFRIIPDESVRLVELEAGTVHVAIDMAGADMRRANARGMKLLSAPPVGAMTLFFNVKRITDPLVRQAVSYAVDRPTIMRALYPNNLGEVSYYYMPRALQAWDDPGIPVHEFDSEKAKTMLNEAGWKVGPDGIRVNSKGEKLSWDMLAPTIPSQIAAAEMISGMLKRVGIQTRIQINDFRTYEGMCIKGDHDLCYYEWPGSSTADPWHNTLMTSSGYFWNMGQIRDPLLDKLHQESITTLDRTKRKKIIKDYLTHVQRNALYVTVGHKPMLYMTRPEVRDVHVAFTRVLFHNTWLERR